MGTETEFGILSRDGDRSDPVANSLQLIAHYPSLLAPQGIWDYENENPLLDARGFQVEGERERPGPAYNRQLNKLLANGGRLYVDGAHPEYSTPECHHPRELVAYERAGECVAAACLRAMNEQYGTDAFYLYKNNSDGKGNSYGYHENYLLARSVPFDMIVQGLLPFFVTRQIFAGAGKVGAENATDPVAYQIAQRSDFFECLVDLNTMVNRPIINTRDEPHADPSRFRRLHVIVGDANMSEWSTYLKVGTAAIVIQMLEAGADLPALVLNNPIEAIKAISRDWQFEYDIQLEGGKNISAIDLQRQYLHAAHQFFACHELTTTTKDLLVHWERVLDQLEQDPMQLADELDWVAKRAMMLSYMGRKGCGWDDPRIKLLDLQYHDIRPDKGVYHALERGNRIKRLLNDADIQTAEYHPPSESRAYFRGMCLKKFPQAVYGMSWTSVLFDVGKNAIKRIPLMNPSRGTQALTQDLFEGVETVDQLLERLES
ncbi:MAG: proteasome accessory factor PafA2 [Nitrospirales bacterium]|nr:proteasome accessory factor PafA2 [Nitrospirales bacterium]